MNIDRKQKYISQLPSYITLIDENYDGRKKMDHQCSLCNGIFKANAKQIKKLTACPLCNKALSVIEIEFTENKNKPSNQLTIQQYIQQLPIRKKLIEPIININTPVQHKCMNCKKRFTISPQQFYDNNYICTYCGK